MVPCFWPFDFALALSKRPCKAKPTSPAQPAREILFAWEYGKGFQPFVLFFDFYSWGVARRLV